ncbi:hypothetical protein KP509_20G075600 [Ceratopteris richardii]|uniref:Uncharacterized protein n=1 Tax=Ceratopteris richardii TaxID=49495 RepID=A0A8T2SK06_CERRI|nr:hypothetical protein KP509_20G075600 [Ceratopteris richardii]
MHEVSKSVPNPQSPSLPSPHCAPPHLPFPATIPNHPVTPTPPLTSPPPSTSPIPIPYNPLAIISSLQPTPAHNIPSSAPFSAVADTLEHMLELCEEERSSVDSQLAALHRHHTNATTMHTLLASLISYNQELRDHMDHLEEAHKRDQQQLLGLMLGLSHQKMLCEELRKENKDLKAQIQIYRDKF